MGFEQPADGFDFGELRQEVLAREVEVSRGFGVALHRGAGFNILAGGGSNRAALRFCHTVATERVALLLVISQRRVPRRTARQGGVERIREQIDVAEGVANAQREARILVTSGVTDQRPARPVRLAEEVRQIGCA